MYTTTGKFSFNGSHILNGTDQTIQEHTFGVEIIIGCEVLGFGCEIVPQLEISAIVNELQQKFSRGMLMHSDQYNAIQDHLQSFIPADTHIVNLGAIEPEPANIAKFIFDEAAKAIDRLDVDNDPMVLYVELTYRDVFNSGIKFGYGDQ